ncbi:nucleotidyl transferase AbiEii/AbiGii toxin family protein [Streptomyces canus]|uniref:nucleotidyl transferase AbiEii/AbiGii toxin family protein n=1 Tax=Streptomyces canus TaxID=58343 RepID=UPI002E292739|nr:nucleotidyl transferase AbiEii/AbiGii toxin family protein [Streptomyces canus]
MAHQPVVMDVGPVVDLEDLVVMKVRALGDRGLPRDVIDVHAACRYYSVIELEQLGAQEEGEFDLVELRDRLESVVWVSDEEFAASGISPEDIAELRRWALDWESDLGLRLAEDYDDPEDAGD